MNEGITELLKQLSFLSSLLAGFALTAAIELIALGNKRKIASCAIALFLFTAVISVTSTFVQIGVFSRVIDQGLPHLSQEWVSQFIFWIGELTVLSFFVFLTGIALTGWLRSKVLGILTTTFSALAFAFLIFILVNLSQQ